MIEDEQILEILEIERKNDEAINKIMKFVSKYISAEINTSVFNEINKLRDELYNLKLSLGDELISFYQNYELKPLTELYERVSNLSDINVISIVPFIYDIESLTSLLNSNKNGKLLFSTELLKERLLSCADEEMFFGARRPFNGIVKSCDSSYYRKPYTGYVVTGNFKLTYYVGTYLVDGMTCYYQQHRLSSQLGNDFYFKSSHFDKEQIENLFKEFIDFQDDRYSAGLMNSKYVPLLENKIYQELEESEQESEETEQESEKRSLYIPEKRKNRAEMIARTQRERAKKYWNEQLDEYQKLSFNLDYLEKMKQIEAENNFLASQKILEDILYYYTAQIQYFRHNNIRFQIERCLGKKLVK